MLVEVAVSVDVALAACRGAAPLGVIVCVIGVAGIKVAIGSVAETALVAETLTAVVAIVAVAKVGDKGTTTGIFVAGAELVGSTVIAAVTVTDGLEVTEALGVVITAVGFASVGAMVVDVPGKGVEIAVEATASVGEVLV